MTQVDAIAFDLDDTLCDYQGAKESALDHLSGMVSKNRTMRERFIAAYRLNEPRLFNAFLTKHITIEDYRLQRFHNALISCGVHPSPTTVTEYNETYMRYCNREVQLFPEALSALNTLIHSRIPLALITNGPADGQRTKINALGIANYFDAILISSEVGVVKPDARIYQKAAEALRVETSNLLMVGDSLNEDYRGALNAGCQALLINRKSVSINSVPAVITNLTQVMGKVERRNPAPLWGSTAR